MTETHSDGRTLTYAYTGEGQLYSVHDSKDNRTYKYNYDTLGRLAGSVQSDTNFRSFYTYDDCNRMVQWVYNAPGFSGTLKTSYAYNDYGLLTDMSLFTGDKIVYEHNALTQVKSRTVADRLKENYTFLSDVSQKKTTNMVSGKQTTVNGKEMENFQYQYDKVWNITQVKETKSGTTVDYTYDVQGQLLSATHKTGTTTTRTEQYSYDTYGNIRSFDNGITSHTYTYGDSNWLDLLTAVDGHALTYDQIGNPTRYYNGTTYIMDWTDGRRLRQLMDDKNFYTYEYDLNGVRTKKTGPEGSTEYIVIDGKAVGERVRDANGTYKYNLRYLFDETGSVCGFSRNNFGENFWVNYYFSKNLQGDVTAIYRADSTGFGLVATYTYDSWGNVISKTGNFADINPFRYRGYYQDNESGFYYLQSRYYDPSIGRFINADVLAATGQGFLGYNMFAYCNNNPVIYSDCNGFMANGFCTYNMCDNGKGYGWNIQNMMNFFGVNSPSKVPDLPDGAMVFLEVITSVSIGVFSCVEGRTIVMDNEKYCEYTFKGIALGYSPIPIDKTITAGYVYGVNDPSDYAGYFFGGSTNLISSGSGGAVAPNGVTAEILGVHGYLSASLGVSITNYKAVSDRWVYAPAPITSYAEYYPKPYSRVGPTQV